MGASDNASPMGLRVLVPRETGAWGVLAETVLAGLIADCTVAGSLAAAALATAFLLRQPLRRLCLHEAKAPPSLRRWAIGLALATGLLLGAVTLHSGWRPLLPLIATALLGGWQFIADLRHEGRQLLPELAGSVGMTAWAMTIVLAGGAGWPAALLLWALLATRQIVTILYVRYLIRRQRRVSAAAWPMWLLHGLAAAAAATAFAHGWPPWPALVAIALLAIRTPIGVWVARRTVKARVLGFSELGLGLVYAILAGLAASQI